MKIDLGTNGGGKLFLITVFAGRDTNGLRLVCTW